MDSTFSRMIRFFLKLIGRKIVYVCAWGTYEYRYDSIDRQMLRPIHEDMSVAPPWAKRRIVPIGEVISRREKPSHSQCKTLLPDVGEWTVTNLDD